MLADHLYSSAVDVCGVHLIVRRLDEKKLEYFCRYLIPRKKDLGTHWLYSYDMYKDDVL